MARFLTPVPLAEIDPPAHGTIWGHAYKDARQLISDVEAGKLQVVDTTLEPLGEGIFENIQDDESWD